VVVVRRWLAEARGCLAPICGPGYGRLWHWGRIGQHSILGRTDSNWATFARLYRHVRGLLAIEVHFMLVSHLV